MTVRGEVTWPVVIPEGKQHGEGDETYFINNSSKHKYLNITMSWRRRLPELTY